MNEMVSLSDVFQVVVAVAMATGGWFIKKIFDELEKSRSNERELYQKIAQTREDMLQLEIERLRALVK